VDIKSFVRDVPDFPKPGILFRDITPLLASPPEFAEAIRKMAAQWAFEHIQAIAALDARGFVFGTALAMHIRLPLVLIRKKDKLPGATFSQSYDLEYGSSTIEMSVGAVDRGNRVLVVDDLLATGGTAKAACSLIKKAGGTVVGCAFVIELTDLPGRQVLQGVTVKSLAQY
jgi:adenine phosphoribosyltransferase